MPDCCPRLAANPQSLTSNPDHDPDPWASTGGSRGLTSLRTQRSDLPWEHSADQSAKPQSSPPKPLSLPGDADSNRWKSVCMSKDRRRSAAVGHACPTASQHQTHGSQSRSRSGLPALVKMHALVLWVWFARCNLYSLFFVFLRYVCTQASHTPASPRLSAFFTCTPLSVPWNGPQQGSSVKCHPQTPQTAWDQAEQNSHRRPR